ncbi:MAG TPA: type II toxin-antitoxin system Phd/YefM family antitoxin [Acidobacteria bacterium]|nr:type II toxin-antitoxin system Phd/YefM family antitoxin [Acidobacteriota bacterium]
MDISEAIEPVTVLKRSAAELIRRARESRRPVIITQNGRATAVLVDVETYQRQRKALHMLEVLARGELDYREGRLLEDSDADERFRALLENAG